MPITTKAPLGATTVNRKWYLDVNTGTEEAPAWTGVFGIAEFAPSKDYTTQDSSDFDSEGFKSDTVTALGWGAEFKVQRKVAAANAATYDPGQEYLRAASDQIGTGNVVEIRYYEYNGPTGPKVEAYRGFVGVQWSEDGGGMDALSAATVTLTGQGKRNPITHPADDEDAGTPTVTSLSPSTVGIAGGDVVVITGTNFVDVEAVAVDGTDVDADRFVVLSSTKIALSVPADSAGTVDVTVETEHGTSGTGASTKLTYA